MKLEKGVDKWRKRCHRLEREVEGKELSESGRVKLEREVNTWRTKCQRLEREVEGKELSESGRVKLERQVDKWRKRCQRMARKFQGNELSESEKERRECVINTLRKECQRLEESVEGKVLPKTEKEQLVANVDRLKKKLVRIKEKKGKLVRSPGPREKPFAACGRRQKRRRAETCIIEAGEPTVRGTTDKLLHSAHLSTSDPHRRWVLKRLMECGAKELRDALYKEERSVDQSPMTPEECIALKAQHGISQTLMRRLHNRSLLHGQNGESIFPNRTERDACEAQCIPEGLSGNNCGASCSAVNVVSHTLSRFADALNMDPADCAKTKTRKYHVLFKGGIDGSGNHPIFRHEECISNDEGIDVDYSHVTISSLTPLVIARDLDYESTIWENPYPNSCTYLRPVKIVRAAETEELVKQMYAELLTPHRSLVEAGGISFNVRVIITGLDGKARNFILGNNSSCTCGICDLNPSRMNGPKKKKTRRDFDDIMKRPTGWQRLRAGCSLLHLRMKAMEALVNIGTRLRLPKKFHNWNRNPDMDRYLKEYDIVCKELRRIDKLIVIKSSKSSRGNRGNISRAFFREDNHAKVAAVLQIPVGIVRDIATLLIGINSKRRFDVDAYIGVARRVFNEYVRLAPWYYMSPGLHILIFHVPQMQKMLHFPISWTSEESTESINKVIRRALRNKVRPNSMKDINTSLMRYLYICSDPKIAREFHYPYARRGEVPGFAMELYPAGVDVKPDLALSPLADDWEISDLEQPTLENRFRKRMKYIRSATKQ